MTTDRIKILIYTLIFVIGAVSGSYITVRFSLFQSPPLLTTTEIANTTTRVQEEKKKELEKASTETTRQDASISNSEARRRTKGVRTTISSQKKDGTPYEAKIEEFDIEEVIDSNNSNLSEVKVSETIEKETEVKKVEERETNTTTILPVVSPLSSYSMGIGYNWKHELVQLSGGVRLGKLPVFIFGYGDFLHLDKSSGSITIENRGLGFGLRVEF